MSQSSTETGEWIEIVDVMQGDQLNSTDNVNIEKRLAKLEASDELIHGKLDKILNELKTLTSNPQQILRFDLSNLPTSIRLNTISNVDKMPEKDKRYIEYNRVRNIKLRQHDKFPFMREFDS